MRGKAKGVSPAEKEKIRQMWSDGHGAAYIAKEVGRDKKTIYNVTKGLRRQKWKYNGAAKRQVEPFLPEIHGRYEVGERLVDLAAEQNISVDYLITLLKRHDFPIRERGWNFGKYDVGAHEFVEAWQVSSSIDEVCERLNMPRSAVGARAAKYRSNGVPLKSMLHRGAMIDWNNLAEFAKSFREEEDAESI